MIFQGPDAYISPSLLSFQDAKRRSGSDLGLRGKVCARNTAFINDIEWLHSFVAGLTATHEASRPEPWKIGDAPREYIEKMLHMIVGFEFSIVRLTGKWKVSQNRPATDQLGVVCTDVKARATRIRAKSRPCSLPAAASSLSASPDEMVRTRSVPRRPRAGTQGAAIREIGIALAQLCDELGYERYWVSEHHNSASIVGTAPEILIAAIAATTRRIRVGSAGVMLPPTTLLSRWRSTCGDRGQCAGAH